MIDRDPGRALLARGCRIVPIILIAVVGCAARETPVRDRAPGQAPAGPEIALESDLGAADFEKALVGKWTSVFMYESKPNVQSLEFRSNGTASLVIVRDGKTQDRSGAYTVTFDREPSAGAITLATIVIGQQSADPIVLSRASFGLHSGIPVEMGPVLRIEGEPCGVLQKAD